MAGGDLRPLPPPDHPQLQRQLVSIGIQNTRDFTDDPFHVNFINRYIYIIKEGRRNSEVETIYLTQIPHSNVVEVCLHSLFLEHVHNKLLQLTPPDTAV